MIAYRIVEMKDGVPHTLFHGVKGSRRLSYGQWYEARTDKMVVDGSGQTPYRPGFHCFADSETAHRYLSNFTAERTLAVIKCQVEGLSEKPTNPDVILADRMKPLVADGRSLLV